MNENLRKQIYNNLQSKDIYEQLEIWRKNDRTQWSDLTFEILEGILSKKLDAIPEQDAPTTELDEKNNGLEEWEENLLNEKNQPVLYEPLKVLDLKDKITWAANAIVVIYILEALINNELVMGIFFNMGMDSLGIGDIINSFFKSAIRASVNIIPVYFPLRAIPIILRILMEMEFNSRKK